MKTLREFSGKEVVGTVVISAGLVLAAWQQWVNLNSWEVLGFITGAVSVWLAAKEHVWNWPIGLINSLSFFFLFIGPVKLYGSAGIQILYLILGLYGWYMWLYGGEQQTELRIGRLTFRPFVGVVAGTSVSFALMYALFVKTNDPAPFWDALTTALSLAAMYLLTIKVIENWLVWITADVMFIGLYASESLYLTAFLYVIFLVICIVGLRDWWSKYSSWSQGEIVHG